MEHHKKSKLSNGSTASKFVTRKWIGVNDLSCKKCHVNKNIRFKSPCLSQIYVNIVAHILL